MGVKWEVVWECEKGIYGGRVTAICDKTTGRTCVSQRDTL